MDTTEDTLAAPGRASGPGPGPGPTGGHDAGVDHTLAAPEASGIQRSTRSNLAVPERGEAIGRYLVLSKLGAGAMGVVLAGYDPELDRKVAIKLIKNPSHRGSSGQAEDARTRLQREAQALAKLSHQNVVGVHDVGLHKGQVFVAMEFVRGQTLTDWMRFGASEEEEEELEEGQARPVRPWRAVLEIFLAAGEGLGCLLYTSPSPRDQRGSRMPSSA